MLKVNSIHKSSPVAFLLSDGLIRRANRNVAYKVIALSWGNKLNLCMDGDQ